MPRRGPDLDDAAVEALLTGRAALSQAAGPLAEAIAEIRAARDTPARPSPELAARMAAGSFDDVSGRARWHGRGTDRPGRAPAGIPAWRRARMTAAEMLATVAAKVAGMGAAAKALTGLTVAAASVSGAAAAGVLPEAAQHRVERAVEAVTPFEFPDQAADKAKFGSEVAEDAVDGGVDGSEISEKARELGNRPDDVPAGPRSHPTGEPTAVPVRDMARPADQADDRAGDQVADRGSAPRTAPTGKPDSDTTRGDLPDHAPAD